MILSYHSNLDALNRLVIFLWAWWGKNQLSQDDKNISYSAMYVFFSLCLEIMKIFSGSATNPTAGNEIGTLEPQIRPAFMSWGYNVLSHAQTSQAKSSCKGQLIPLTIFLQFCYETVNMQKGNKMGYIWERRIKKSNYFKFHWGSQTCETLKYFHQAELVLKFLWHIWCVHIFLRNQSTISPPFS